MVSIIFLIPITMTAIVRLLFSCCPSTVAWFVPAIVVDAVYR